MTRFEIGKNGKYGIFDADETTVVQVLEREANQHRYRGGNPSRLPVTRNGEKLTLQKWLDYYRGQQPFIKS